MSEKVTEKLSSKRTRADDKVSPRVDNRRELLMQAAAGLFATYGYAGTSVRDIANAVGMLPGSMYYHFKSKEELLLTVHAAGVAHIHDAVQDALDAAGNEPWGRLKAAAIAHLKTLLDGSHYSMIMAPEFHLGIENELRLQVVAQRDSYELIFKDLIDTLPLPEDVNRAYLRLGIFGSLNWAMTWFRPDGDCPEKIASEIIDLYRRQLDPNA